MLTAHLEEQVRSFLGKQAIFSLLGQEAIDRLVQRLEMVSFAMGEIILSEGEAGDGAYLIYSGKVRVFKQGRSGKPVILGTLAAGDLFGEQALVHREARSASARAAEDAVLFRVRREDFENALDAHPELVPYLERLMRQRAASNFLRLATFLGALPARQVIALLDRLQDCQFQSGHTIVREGDAGDRMYIIKSGEAKVIRGESQVLAYLGEGDYFGERALILNEPRYASVIAVTAVECYSLSRQAFASMLSTAPQLQEQLSRRLEQYRRGAELAGKVELRPPPGATVEQSAPDLVWEKIGDQPEPVRPSAEERRGWRSWLPFLKPFPFIAQEDETDCGAAALAMVGRYHGRRLSPARLRDLAHVGSTGASMLGLAQAAQEIGFHWRAVTTDFAHLAGLNLPAVAHWKGYHYLVLYETRAEKVVVGDPAVGLVTMSRHQFEAGWTGKLLLLSPTERLRSHRPARTGLRDWSSLLAPFRSSLTALILASLVLAVLPLALPLVTQLLVDRVLLSQDAGLLFPIFSGLLLAGTFQVTAALLRQGLIERLVRKLNIDLSAGWFERLVRLPLAYFHSRPIGSFLVRLEGCHESQSLVRLTLTAILDLPLLAAVFGAMLYYQATLALVAVLAFVPAIAWPLLSVFSSGRRQQAWLQKSAEHTALVESIQSLATLKDATAEEETCRKFAQAAGASPGPAPPALGLAAAANLLINAVILCFGAGLVLDGQITLGRLVAFQTLVGLAAVPILGWAGLWPNLLLLPFLLQKLSDIQETATEQDQPAPLLPPVRGHIRFEDVSFRYHPEGPSVLSRINLEVQAGQIVALVGRSGAGKSTLAMLLQRFYSPTEGTVRIDGHDLAAVDVRSLRSQVCVVWGEPTLVTGTIRDNIALADPGAALERAIGSAKLANAHDFIMALPRGYDTVIGSGGMRLSAGQSQCLCLARAFLKEPRILILDDVLSALDAETEEVVVRNLHAAGPRTTILVSRRPPPASCADVIVVMDAGQIIEMGSHRELLEQNGLYCFWVNQFVSFHPPRPALLRNSPKLPQSVSIRPSDTEKSGLKRN